MSIQVTARAKKRKRYKKTLLGFIVGFIFTSIVMVYARHINSFVSWDPTLGLKEIAICCGTIIGIVTLAIGYRDHRRRREKEIDDYLGDYIYKLFRDPYLSAFAHILEFESRRVALPEDCATILGQKYLDHNVVKCAPVMALHQHGESPCQGMPQAL